VLRPPSHGLYSKVAELDVGAQFSGYTKEIVQDVPKTICRFEILEML
jgi:hypothetical protein